MDTKQLESLSYEPANIVGRDADGADPEPANIPPETLGFNAHVIRPELKVNSKEIAEQVLGQANKLEQPNQSIKIIEEIEGLMREANKAIYKLEPFAHTKLKNQALEEIDLFQKTTLRELKSSFISK